MRMFCTTCLDDRDIEFSTRLETLVVRGEPVEVESRVARCLTCRNDVFDTDLADETLRRAHETYRKTHGLLSSDEIMEIRTKYGLSHRCLSQLMGWGQVTVQRYEHGAIQDEAHDSLLRQMRDDPMFVLRQYEKNRDRLSETEGRNLRQRISELCSGSGAALLIRVFQNEQFLAYERNPHERGLRPFDFDRVTEVVLFFASRLSDLYQTKLAKLLWIADFASHLERGESITGLAYARLPYGPVPDRFRVLLALMEDTGSIVLEPWESQSFAGEIITARKPSVHSPSLLPDEICLLQRVIQKYGSMSSKRLSALSHRESIWADSTDGSLLPYSKAGSVEMVREL